MKKKLLLFITLFILSTTFNVKALEVIDNIHFGDIETPVVGEVPSISSLEESDKLFLKTYEAGYYYKDENDEYIKENGQFKENTFYYFIAEFTLNSGYEFDNSTMLHFGDGVDDYGYYEDYYDDNIISLENDIYTICIKFYTGDRTLLDEINITIPYFNPGNIDNLNELIKTDKEDVFFAYSEVYDITENDSVSELVLNTDYEFCVVLISPFLYKFNENTNIYINGEKFNFEFEENVDFDSLYTNLSHRNYLVYGSDDEGYEGVLFIQFVDTPRIEYNFLEGENLVIENETNPIFSIDADFSKFINEVYVDGNLLDESNYTAETGSTIITLTPEYLDTLENGEHELKALFDDGYSITNFNLNIEEVQLPDEGEQNPQTVDNIYIFVIISLISLFGIITINKKRVND